MTTNWELIKGFAIILNYLLIPLAVGIWKIICFINRMNERIIKIELLHQLKECDTSIKDFSED